MWCLKNKIKFDLNQLWTCPLLAFLSLSVAQQQECSTWLPVNVLQSEHSNSTSMQLLTMLPSCFHHHQINDAHISNLCDYGTQLKHHLYPEILFKLLYFHRHDLYPGRLEIRPFLGCISLQTERQTEHVLIRVVFGRRTISRTPMSLNHREKHSFLCFSIVLQDIRIH